MSNEEAKRKVKELLKEIQAEERQEQTSSVQTPKKLSQIQKLAIAMRKEGMLPPRDLKEDKVTPRYMYSYSDHPSKDILVQINEDLLKQAKDEASKRRMSLSSYLRESLIHRLYKITPEKELDIDHLLEECTSQEEKTLIIEGEKGFLNQLTERGLTGSVWTPSQIDKVTLRLGRIPRSTEEQCIQAMKLDKVQIQYFTTQIEYVRNTESEKEEIYFVPFAICDQCHRPLTKDQSKLENCPYCNGTKGTAFVYDEKASAQPKPYAMCRKCHRPLPEEAKTWKQCKYCGTTEPEIVLNYEGIQRQTPSSTLTLDKKQAEEILETVAESEQASEESEES